MIDDDKASRSVIFEILQNVVTGQTAAEPTGKRSDNASVYCGKTKVFMANSVVSMLFLGLQFCSELRPSAASILSVSVMAFPGFS